MLQADAPARLIEGGLPTEGLWRMWSSPNMPTIFHSTASRRSIAVAASISTAHLKALFGLSERRACQIAGADRKMVRYQSQRAPDTALRGRLRDLANERRRFGYRRLFVLLRREGEPLGINRIYRLYTEEGLTVRKRKARSKALGTRALRGN